MSRLVGVEIEWAGDRDRLVDALRDQGLAVQNTRSHLGYSQTEWTVKHDGSVCMGTGRGGELVSPPLDFDNPAERGQVDRAVAALQIAGCRPDPSAGIHVHVDASDLDPCQVAAVGRFFWKFEDLIYRLASSGWRTMRRAGMQTYCRPMTDATARSLTKVRDMDGFYRAWYGGIERGHSRSRQHHDGSRYCGLNLHVWAYGQAGRNNGSSTIEFRVFNSSINPKRIQAYMALSVAIVQDARNGYSRSTGKNYPLGGMAADTVKADRLLLRFQQIMRSNSRDTTICMTKEDWKLVRYCWADSLPQVAPGTRVNPVEED